MDGGGVLRQRDVSLAGPCIRSRADSVAVPSPEAQGGNDTARVVAVVVTYKRPRELATLLTALKRQTIPLARIIVVDNDGTPETADVIGREIGRAHV